MITNQQPETFQNSHSRVIYKNFNDTDTRDFLNSYRYEPSRNKKYKKWKPDISPEERFKKKREREEDYLQNFHPDDRPVLVVQRKHEYQDIANPNVFADPGSKEAYYKVSENTDTVDDITYEIKSLENFIKRHTLVHKKNKNKEEENLSSIYKVEGKEFLPEGFIELDPLLYKDEYEFDNELDQKRFDKEQRKLKMLRRKQYEQRHDNKIRDVTIFVMDEQKNRTLIFLEKWVDQHRRKMNKQEIEYVADNLQVAPHKLKKLQDLYFKKMEILRNRQFGNEGLKGQGELKDIPSGMRNQFQQNKYEDVDSRYMKSQQPFKPTYLDKIQKKQIKKNKNKSNQNSKLIDTDELDQTLKETSQDKKIQNSKQGGGYSQIHQQKYKVDSKKNNNQNTSRKNSQKSYRKESKKNSRANISNRQSINELSNKQSKGQISNKQSKGKISNRQSKDQISHNQSQNTKNSVQFSQSKQSQKIEDLTNPFEQMLNNDDNLKKQDTNDNLQVIKKDQKQNFENDLQKYFDDEIHSILNKIKDTGSQKNNLVEQNDKDEETPESREYIESFKQKLIKKDNNLKQLVNNNKQQTDVQNIPIQKLPKRLTIFAQNQNGDLKTTFKLKPIVLGNEYFYQTVEQKYNPNGSIEATLVTKNDQGQILDIASIPNEKIGKFYSNEVVDKQPDFQGDQGKYVIVKNDKDELIHKQILRPRQEFLNNDEPEKQLKTENFKKEKIHEDGYIKTHNLNPIDFNGKEYKQVIEEINNDDNKKQINILTYDTNNEILANEKIKPFFQTETYYSEIKTEILNDNKKKFSLITKNKNGEILSEFDLDKVDQDNKEQYMKNQTVEQDKGTTVYNLNPVIVGDRILKQEIHLPQNKSKAFIKTFNDYNQEINSQPIGKSALTSKDYSELCDNDDTLELLTKNKNGNVIGKFTLPEEYNKVVKNDKFDEIVEIVDLEGQRRATIATKALPEFQFRSYQLRPTLIGNQFYQQTINELVKSQDSSEPKAVLITKNEEGEILDIQDIEDSKVAQDYYNEIVDENINEQGKRKATLVTYNNNNEEIGRVGISQSLAQRTGDQYYEEVLEEIVNEDDNQSEQIELIKIDKDDDGKVQVEQVQVDKEQAHELEPVGNEEYYDKLVDLFAQKNQRRSFQKNEGQINRNKAQTYAQIPIDYQAGQMLTKESKKQIDHLVQEVKEAEQQQQLEQEELKEQPYEEDEDENEEDVQQEEPKKRKQTRRVTKDSQPNFVNEDYQEDVQEKERDFQPRKSQVSRYSSKYGPLEGYKKAKERVRSKTRKSKSKKNKTMSFKEMEEKMNKIEQQRQSQIDPYDETRSKQTSVIGKDFRPSVITKIYEDKYGSNKMGSERFKKQSVNVRDYSKTIQPMGRDKNLLDQKYTQKQSEKQIDNVVESMNDFDKDASIMDNKEFLKTEQEIHDIIESKKNIDNQESQREVDNQQSQREVDNQESQREVNQKQSQREVDQKQSQREVDQKQSQREVDVQKKIGSKRSMKNKQSKKSIKQKQSKKKLPSKKNIGSKRETKKAEEQVIFEGLKDKDNFLMDEILKKKKEDQNIELQNEQNNEEGSDTELKDLDKSYASAVTYELKRQVDRDKDLVDRLAKAAGLSRGELLEDFYDFCVRLPNDKKYKESIVFATMFYFYMEQKKKEL